MENGTILAGTWGATMVIPEFYKVVKMTAKTAKVVKMKKKMLTPNSYGQQGYEVPSEEGTLELAEPLNARLTNYGWVVTDKYHTKVCVEEWNGQPIWADYMD